MNERTVEAQSVDERPALQARVFVLGGNASTLAFVHNFQEEKGTIPIRLVPLAWTPIGVVCGDAWQNVGVAPGALLEWVDRTFPPEDERAFMSPLRDVELLLRIGWQGELPQTLDAQSVLNIDDLPDEIADALAHPAQSLVQCAACRRLCVRDDFVWSERRLCAWDYHQQVFGKRGPWREGAYESRHFETLPACAYVAAPLLEELDVDVVLSVHDVDDGLARRIVNDVIAADAKRPHLAVRLGDGYTVMRERGASVESPA